MAASVPKMISIRRPFRYNTPACNQETDGRMLAVTVRQCLNGRAPPYLSWSTASRSPVLTRAGICVPPTVIYLPYRVSGLTSTAVGRSQLLARWPGTHSRILSGIQRAAQTVLGVYLKRARSRITSASSAFSGSQRLRAVQIHALTHSLIHFQTSIGTLWTHTHIYGLCHEPTTGVVNRSLKTEIKPRQNRIYSTAR